MDVKPVAWQFLNTAIFRRKVPVGQDCSLWTALYDQKAIDSFAGVAIQLDHCERVRALAEDLALDRLRSLDAIFPLVECATQVVAAFERLGKTTGIMDQIESHRDCELTLIALKAACDEVSK